ncbi:MAG: hypothetical protein EBZ59_12705, partial [Planctomycetia bacterium]|nr:hypothetical protein [Planctomycetia bacterium]
MSRAVGAGPRCLAKNRLRGRSRARRGEFETLEGRALLSAAPGDNRFFGAIAAPGQVDTHTLTTTATTRLWFDSQTNASSLGWNVAGPRGVVGAASFSTGDGLLTEYGQPAGGLLPAGTYTIRVSGYGDATGSYMFRVLDLAAASSITAGSVVVGTLPTPNGTSVYTLTAAAGDRFQFTNVSLQGDGGRWRLVDPYGQQVFDSPMASTMIVDLTATGDYSLILDGAIDATQAASYGFVAGRLSNTPPPAITGTVIAPGTAVNGVVEAGGQ